MLDTTLLILLGLAALGFVSHNTTVAISILVLIIVRVTPLNAFFPWIEKQGANRQRYAPAFNAAAFLR